MSSSLPGPAHGFPIVGVGASAGGLEAFMRLLKALPEDLGMALVLVQHLDPTHDSLLVELISKAAPFPVTQVRDGMRVESGCIYVIPPNADMVIDQGVLRLEQRRGTRAQHRPIDMFMRSLAEDQKGRAIGVVLSGSGSDGTLGMTAIKAQGGITFAQSESSAKYDSMPHSAITAGGVDFVLEPERIAAELARIRRHPCVQSVSASMELPAGDEGTLGRIFQLLCSTTGVDFTHYKQNTVKRRIKRRMVLHKLETLEDYLEYLKSYIAEVQALHEDILINVTSFFREPEVFDALKAVVFTAIAKRRSEDEAIRIWVPGCSTGEEAYSLAIALLEHLDTSDGEGIIQIFGTDISDTAIEAARAGIYPESIVLDVSPDRLRRYFLKVSRGYQISKHVRDLCVFARQDLTHDPPFSRLDLISCRNVLIYLGPLLQKKVLPIFHYSLKPRGFLLLGSSETIGSLPDLFSLVHKRHRIYAKRATHARVHIDFGTAATLEKERPPARRKPQAPEAHSIQSEMDRLLLSRYVPASVLVSEDLEILQFRGRTGQYLEPISGQASLNLLRMARPGLAIELGSLLDKVKKNGSALRREHVDFDADGRPHRVNIEVLALNPEERSDRVFLILFEEDDGSGRKRARTHKVRPKGAATDKELGYLRQELSATREYLQSIVEEQEATNEELRSANEEILSSNEELQSTNEELETSMEELQSTNEELTTVTEELQNRNVELSTANNDLLNVLGSINITIVLLGADLRIRRVTPTAERLLNILPADIGRRIGDIRPNIDAPDLEKTILEVIDTITVRERIVQDREGRWYSMRLRPYRTSDNKIEGVVLTLVDIDDLKKSLQQLQESHEYAQAIVDTVRDGLLVIDEELRVRRVNRSFCEMFQTTSDEVHGRTLQEMGKGLWNIPRMMGPLRELVSDTSRTEGIQFEVDILKPGRRTVHVIARPMFGDKGSPRLMLLALEDVTEKRSAEKTVHELSGRLLQLRDEEQRRIARELHDSTAQVLSALGMKLAVLEAGAKDLSPRARQALEESVDLAKQTSMEVRDLSFLLHPPLLDEAGLGSALHWYIESFQRRTGIAVAISLPESMDRLPEDFEIALFRIVQEGLTNVNRHSGSLRATVRIARADHEVEVQVIDEGKGISGKGDGPRSRQGVGIAGMRERVHQLGGRFDIRSGQNGTTIRATLPLPGDPSS